MFILHSTQCLKKCFPLWSRTTSIWSPPHSIQTRSQYSHNLPLHGILLIRDPAAERGILSLRLTEVSLSRHHTDPRSNSIGQRARLNMDELLCMDQYRWNRGVIHVRTLLRLIVMYKGQLRLHVRTDGFINLAVDWRADNSRFRRADVSSRISAHSFITLTPRSLPKIPAFFAREPNSKWRRRHP